MTEFAATPPIESELRPHSWIETFMGILVAPRQTMRELALLNDARLTGFGGAVIAVVLPCALDGLRITPPSKLGLATAMVPMSIVLGLLMWATMAGLLSLLAWIFGSPIEKNARIRRTFVLMGWSFAPWIFMAPIYCYRDALGIWFAMLAVIPFAWMFILQILAVKVSFELRSLQTLVLFFAVPALYFFLQILQMAQGFYVSFASVL
jgi:hypothetical protein